jgi:hypothetical protein
MSSRIYIVTRKNEPRVPPVALVRAASQSQAIRAAVGREYSAEVASQDDIIQCLSVLDMEIIDAATKETSNG